MSAHGVQLTFVCTWNKETRVMRDGRRKDSLLVWWIQSQLADAALISPCKRDWSDRTAPSIKLLICRAGITRGRAYGRRVEEHYPHPAWMEGQPRGHRSQPHIWCQDNSKSRRAGVRWRREAVCANRRNLTLQTKGYGWNLNSVGFLTLGAWSDPKQGESKPWATVFRRMEVIWPYQVFQPNADLMEVRRMATI